MTEQEAISIAQRYVTEHDARLAPEVKAFRKKRLFNRKPYWYVVSNIPNKGGHWFIEVDKRKAPSDQGVFRQEVIPPVRTTTENTESTEKVVEQRNGGHTEMMNIIGVHPIEAGEPCYLIEVELDRPDRDYDWGEVTQEEPGTPRDDWQAPYDERPLNDTGVRWAFFFHYLDCGRPLLAPNGPVALPAPSPLPASPQRGSSMRSRDERTRTG